MSLLSASTAVYGPSFSAIPVALTAVVILVLGIRVSVRRFTSASAAFLAMTVAVGVWMAAFAAMYLARDPELALLWARRAYLGVPFVPATIYWFTVEILRVERRRRLLVLAAWSAAAFFSTIAVTTSRLIPSVREYRWGYSPLYDVTTSVPFLLFFFGFLALSLWEFLRAWPGSRGMERDRIRMLLIAFGVAYLGSIDLLPKYGISVYPFGYLAILGFTAIVAVAVRRYDLVALTPSLAAQEIIGTMGDVLFVCDREGRIEVANRAAASLLGYDEEHFVGLRINDLLARDEDLSSNLGRRSFRSSEHRFVRADGERIELTLSISPVIREGVATGAVIIGRDLRERRRAEREVARAVTLLQSTLDSTADGIVVVDDSRRVLTFNQRFADMWGLTSEGMRGDPADVVSRMASQLVDGEALLTFELPDGEDSGRFDVLQLKDGRRFERYLIVRPVDGGETMRVWSFRDVTAHLAAQAALRQSELRYRLLFEQNAAGVCVTRLDGVIVDCNATFATMLGLGPEQLLGRSMSSLYANAAESEELTALLRSVGTLNSVEIELRRSDGRALWVLENLMLVGEGGSAVVHATVVDISDRKRAEEQIEFHAYHDVLTHLPNRKLFTDRLRQSLTRARRNNKPVAVMFIDIDHFKTVNDTLGHTAGDELLLEMARRLRLCVRDDDTVARLGGDEFTIILSELRQAEDAVSVAGKVLAAVQDPLVAGGTPISTSASIGIALYPADGTDPETLLRNADSAMYRAKEAGRNTYQLCTDEMKQRALERLAVETRLRSALDERQLTLVYQPQVHLVTGRTIGVEALVRWNDPVRGLVEPASFIPVAEETRIILPLGEWVLRTACRQMHEWQQEGAGPLRIAVNLSARQFLQHDLVDMVRNCLDEAELSPSSLELEITETTAMQNAEETVEVMRALRELGVGISIDDFGTGYSSLNYLKRFPISALKIDKIFIDDLRATNGDAAIVSAVISMARTLALRVVAEGVETSEQFAFLRQRQCDEAQGFYFSRPLDAGVMGHLLASRRSLAIHEPRLSI